MAAAVSLDPEVPADAAGRRPGGPEGDPGSDTLIELSHVSKEYDTGGGLVRAMRDVDLVIARGEFVAIVGTSGSGKSTMMNILGCLDRPTRGTYSLAGLDVGSRAGDSRAIVRNRVIGFIFQGFNLLPRTTALENCELPLQYRGVGSRERRKRAREALEAVGLGDRMDHKSNQLSGGQQQRVAIARALVTSPPLLLADEPTGNLDTRTSLEVLALLQRLNRDRGITIVLVTHEQDIARCASRVVTMRDGRIVSDVVQGDPLDAARELASLPSHDEGAAASQRESEEASATASRVRERVPFRVYLAMLLGSKLALAFAYVLFAIAAVSASGRVGLLLAAHALGLGVESWRGAASARKRLGHPLTVDQRIRVALVYTIGTGLAGTAVIVGVTFAKLFPLMAQLGGVSLLALVTDRLAGRVSAVAVGALVGFHAALVLLRYLLLSLFNPRR